MPEVTYPLQRDSRLPAHASRRWIVTPVCLSFLVHIVLLNAIQSVDWLDVAELEREVERMFTIETGTVNPEDLERVVITPGLTLDDIHAVGDTRGLAPGMFPEYRDPGPSDSPDIKPAPRYPEEALPLVSRDGLSERSRAFVRDGELDAVDAGRARIAHLPGGRAVDHPAPGLRVTPKLSDSHNDLAGSVPAREPGFLGKYTAPPPRLRLPRVEAVAPEPRAIELDRGAEDLLGDREPPVPAKPIALEVKVDVYAEPGSEYRFFRMTVAQRKGAKLPVLAKNVLFVVDISASIRLDMLKGVGEAVAGATAGFNRGDQFNVVRFSEQSYKEFETFVPATDESVRHAARSIRKEPGQVRTDVYTAVKNVIAGLEAGQKESARPTNIFLISDGNPTTGIQDIRHIVNDLSAVTKPWHSIFAVNPGARTANAYLLDLLAYRNRGRFVQAESAEATAATILELLKQFKDPVLMNLRAQYGNFEVDQVYPETLPNLYAGRPIVIHGRCLPGETIAVRIIGDSAKGRRKFLHTSTLPEVQTADKSIAREWARGKIHHLSSLIAREGEKKERRDEIRRLSERYKLASPFE